MLTFCREYELLKGRLSSFVALLSKPQRANLSLLVWGLLKAQDCRIRRMARHLPVRAGVGAARERLLRLVKNPAIVSAEVYQTTARLLMSRFQGGTLTLIVDATQLNGRVFLLAVAAALRGRALPLGWQMLDKQSVSCRFALQQMLLERVRALLAPGTQGSLGTDLGTGLGTTVLLLADRDYGTVELVRYCLARGWHFRLRLKRSRVVLLADGTRMSLGSLCLQPGQRRYLAGVRLAGLPQVPLSLCCCLSPEAKDDDAWYILSDQEPGIRCLQEYAKRMHIEQMFRDFKEQGFRLEESGLWDPERVDRLLLGVCLAYVLLVQVGIWVVKNGRRRAAEGYGPRRLSLFMLGYDYLLHALGSHRPLPVHTVGALC